MLAERMSEKMPERMSYVDSRVSFSENVEEDVRLQHLQSSYSLLRKNVLLHITKYQGCWHPSKCNDIVMNFYVQNGSKCNLEYCQHFVASRDLKDFKPLTSLPIF